MPPKYKDASKDRVICNHCKTDGNHKREFTRKNIEAHTKARHPGLKPFFCLINANQSIKDIFSKAKGDVTDIAEEPDLDNAEEPDLKKVKLVHEKNEDLEALGNYLLTVFGAHTLDNAYFYIRDRKVK